MTNLSNIAYSSEYIDYRNEIINTVFNEKNKKGEEIIEEDSLMLKVDYYFFEKNKKYYCAYTKVYNKEKILLHNYFNLYDQHFFCKLIKHSNEHNYLVYKEDLYGYSVFEIDTNKIFNYYPKATFTDHEETFIGTNIHHNIDNNIIAVEGCYWACPYDTFLLKIKSPLEIFTEYINIHQILDKEYDKYDDINFMEWENNNIKLKCYNTISKPPQNEIVIIKEEEYLNKMIKR